MLALQDKENSTSKVKQAFLIMYTFQLKIGGGRGLGSIQKNLGPLLISATDEASSFKFGTQLQFEE